MLAFLVFQISLIVLLPPSQASLCRTFCGPIPINYPFGIDDGCGSPYYRRVLACSDAGQLHLRTPSGNYPVQSISYSDPHILVSDPDMWTCQDGDSFRPTKAFSLDTSTHLSLSRKNEYLFFNCSQERVIIEPKPFFCDRFPEKCDSTCDSASYLCRHMPDCGSSSLILSSCCSYYPKATESLRLMLNYCTTYTSVYWESIGVTPTQADSHQVPQYGIRVDFDIPVTARCLQCQDTRKGSGGSCGFDTQTESFSCLCQDGNVTTYCKDPGSHQHRTRAGVIAGSSISAASALGIGAAILYLKKVRAKRPVTSGVQSNENRLF
uniref:non-specific serine/threonine protein kinase n=1 Tax=Kalanchoe fedtschenkoi TaxID=63787 RepID=A0A7N0TRT6_KALFE